MKIKTYLVSSLAEAVDQIKRDLGPSAVILATKKRPADWWNRTSVKLEVTAAIDYVATPDLPLHDGPAETVETAASSFEPDYLKQNLKADLVEDKITLSSASIQRSEGSSHALVQVCRNLLYQGVRPSTVQELAEKILADNVPDSFEQVREKAAAWLLESLRTPEPYSFENPPKRIALVGPTGSGKTTTLAKLGSTLALDHRKSVAFLTLDRFRIGGEEQLKKYASILGAPCEVVTDDSRFQEALERYSKHDVVLIDTTGRSPYDREGILETRNVLARAGSVWTSLVLPVSLQGAELANAVKCFQPIACRSVTLTKLDEAAAFGSLYNASELSGLPLAYFTTGQKVPEDIETATHERILDCLLNFSGHFGISESLWETPVDFKWPSALAATTKPKEARA